MTWLGRQFPAVLARVSAGDPEAFADLWRSLHPLVLRLLRILADEGGGTSDDAAEELAADVWRHVLPSLRTFSGDERTLRIRLAGLAYQRAQAEGAGQGERAGDTAGSDTAAVPGDEGTEAAIRLVAALPPGQRDVVAVHLVFDLEVLDVARALDRNPVAVRAEMQRGLRTLATGTAGRPAGADLPTQSRRGRQAEG